MCLRPAERRLGVDDLGIRTVGGRPTARAVEIVADPRVRLGSDLRQRTGYRLLVDQHHDAIGNPVEAVEIVGDHHHGEAERLLQRADQLVEGGGTDRIEPGGRLVEKEDLGIERQRPGEPGALAHAARELGRELVGSARLEPGQRQLEPGDLVDQRRPELVPGLERHGDVLRHGERAEQSAVLKQHAGARPQRLAIGVVELAQLLAEQPDPAGGRLHQPGDLADQHGLPGAGATHHRQHLALSDLKLEPVMDHRLAE